MEQYLKESLDPHIYGQLISTKGTKKIQCRVDIFFNILVLEKKEKSLQRK